MNYFWFLTVPKISVTLQTAFAVKMHLAEEKWPKE
jgi:hypothetical protein